jgi:signal transduction histidine kinase
MIAVPIVLFLIFSAVTSFILVRFLGVTGGDTAEIVFLTENSEYIPFYITLMAAMLIVMVAVIFLTNRILTRRMVKSVESPLDTLSYGVEQIKSGNLSFRLDYLGKDEFSPVCAAFNEMAERLQNSEVSRVRDEESRRELIAGISHDLRTPLTSVKAYLEGIEKDVAQTPEQREKYFSTINGKIVDLENIINKLFLFAKLDTNDFPMNMECVNIDSEISEMISGLSEEYGKKGLVLKILHPLPNALVSIDKVLLLNVFLNILENSVKYKTMEIGTAAISGDLENGRAIIRIADNGRGVSEDVLDRIFDVFYRVDPSRGQEGNGLGLAVSAKIIHRMGGEIYAESADGGLAIVIALPIATEREVQ